MSVRFLRWRLAALAIQVQFLKGSLLDYALKGEGGLTLRFFALLLFAAIAAEISCYYLSNRFRGKYYTRVKAALREAASSVRSSTRPPR